MRDKNKASQGKTVLEGFGILKQGYQGKCHLGFG